MSGRFLFVCSALLVLAEVTRGDGIYQSTRDGRTIVWNNHPKPGDQAAWSGGRDREGYARGFGTLVWYTKDTKVGKATLYARYWGNMSQGKLNGPVNVHSKKKTHYAIFDDGTRVTRWSPGTAPSVANARWRAIITRRNTVSEPQAPAEGPSRTGGPLQLPTSNIQHPIVEDSGATGFQLSTAASDIDNSLRMLAWPPRSLRVRPVRRETGTPRANARLTKEEVVDLADAAARARGYDLAEYARPEPEYDPVDQVWSLSYEPKPVVGTAEITKHFSVAVDDRTKRTAFVGKSRVER